MNSTFKLVVAIFFIGNFTFGQEWITTDISDFATIDFPVETELIENAGETALTAKDDYALYMVNLKGISSNENRSLSQKEISEVYEGVIQGSLSASNGELISKKEVEINGISGIEFEYHTPPHAQIPSTRFKRIVYTNNNLITIDFWLLTDQQQDQIEANKDKFFGSLLLNTNINSSPEKESMELQENPAYNTGYAVGYFVGKFIFAIVLIGLAIVLFLLVRYLIRRSKNKKSNAIKSKETFKTEDKIICTKCEGENKSDVKYCSHCGYELHKG